MSDFVQDVSEHDALSSHLLEMFGEHGERTPECGRMARPVVLAAAEPATTYGSRRPRARALRPSGLQSSAVAARPPQCRPGASPKAPPTPLIWARLTIQVGPRAQVRTVAHAALRDAPRR